MTAAPSRVARGKLILAFGAVYVIWGSTFLAIRYAIESIPPFLMAGTRFVAAGAVLWLIARARGDARPTRAQLVASVAAGVLMLAAGNGSVSWSEQYLPSGIAALLVASVALWMVLLDFLRKNGARPTSGAVAGLVLGFAGVALLVGPSALRGDGDVNAFAAIVLVIASLSWAAGSVYSRVWPRPASPFIGAALQMLAGGAALWLVGLVHGDFARFDASAVSARSLLAVLYLIAAGSLIGHSAYVWLLRVSTPATVATYAYVNPVIAMLLGWLIAGEAFSPRMIVAAGVIIAGVALITRASGRASERASGLADERAGVAAGASASRITLEVQTPTR